MPHNLLADPDLKGEQEYTYPWWLRTSHWALIALVILVSIKILISA